MTGKDFENYDYPFVSEYKKLRNQRLIIASVAFVLVLLLFMIWGFFNTLNLFPVTTTNIRRPIEDPDKALEQAALTEQQKIASYKNAGIPYKDPLGRFEIKFLTPYVSDQIAVVFYTPDNQGQIRSEASTIIAKAKKTVAISNVYYINEY